MSKTLSYIVLITFFIVLNGCAVGNKHPYHNVNVDFNGKETTKLLVATLDHRSYIRNENKDPDFVGLQRGGYGNPFDVTTVSGKSLAEDITTTLEHSLRNHGVDVTPLIINYSDSINDAISIMSNTYAHRSLLLVLSKWKSDTFQNTTLIYDVVLKVLDNTGRVIVEKTLNGKDNLGGSFWDPASHAKQAIPLVFKKKLETLLNDKEILSALM